MLRCSCYYLSKAFVAKKERDLGYAKVLKKGHKDVWDIENNGYLDARLKKKRKRRKQKRKNKDSPSSCKNIYKFQKRDMFLRSKVELGFHCIHSTIYIHFIYPYTCTSWFDCMTRFSLDPLFDFTTYALQVCMRCLHTYELYISLSCRKRNAQHHYFFLGEDSQIPHILRGLRVSYNGCFEFYFEKPIKTLG